jgi:hypothetical protein
MAGGTGDQPMKPIRPSWIPVRVWKNASPEERAMAPHADNVINVEDGPEPGEYRVTVCRKSEDGVVYDAIHGSDFGAAKRILVDRTQRVSP